MHQIKTSLLFAGAVSFSLASAEVSAHVNPESVESRPAEVLAEWERSMQAG